ARRRAGGSAASDRGMKAVPTAPATAVRSTARRVAFPDEESSIATDEELRLIVGPPAIMLSDGTDDSSGESRFPLNPWPGSAHPPGGRTRRLPRDIPGS